MTSLDGNSGTGPAKAPDESAVDFERQMTPETTFQTAIVPPEIWLNVFAHLLPAELRATTLTCSLFRWLAQPFLFCIIDVSPFFHGFNGERPILRPHKYLDRTVQRLEFYRSQHIAPAVQHCWISPYSRSGYPARNSRDDLDPDLIIEKVIEALPSFPNLCKLSWHCTDFTMKWWDAICKLPITTLWLNSCTIEGVDHWPLPIRHLDLDQWAWEGEVTNHVSIHEEHSPGVSQTVLPVILHSEHVRHISVPRADTCTHLLSTMSTMDLFTSLRVLRVPLSAMSSPCFVPALIQCPVLEELRIFNPTDEAQREITMDDLPFHALPCLSTYEGPYTYLLLFGTGRPLRKALIWGLDGSHARCDPSRLLHILRRLSLFNPALEILRMSVSYVPDELLAVISSFCRLKSVEISSADNFPTDHPVPESPHQRPSTSPVTLLYITLRDIQFPAQLENLRISTKLNHGNLDKPTQQAEASRLIELMARAHPKLRSVEIGYGTYWTGTYVVRWTRLVSSCNRSASTLGKLIFNEHRRTIVYPDAQRAVLETDLGDVKVARTGNYFVTWLRRLLYKRI
ncbi:hypothetical protein D9615_001167 [Tricholomella constricta]|uniref:F-box domain-containing protein n=1 Tax=Tricholomella constricta TaxID=117010 RepID=A0A8H5M8B6_9AGAR|nr:hypothetical protein D9615_001167 [Tricholomella constricta]